MNMEFLEYNLFNTTTMASVTNGTSTVSYLMDRDSSTQFATSGDNSDLTTTTIRIDLLSAVNISRIILENINFKSFKIYYNSNTANTFTLTNNLTSTSSWVSNSETSLYLIFATTSVSLITINVTSTMAANEEKKCGNLWICNKYHTLTNNPSAKNYKPIFDNKQYNHEMSDGGLSVYKIANSFQATINLDFVSLADRIKLKGIFDMVMPFVFVPEPTGTAWSGDIYEVNWVDDFGFYQFSDNYKGNGYSGSLKIRETPK